MTFWRRRTATRDFDRQLATMFPDAAKPPHFDDLAQTSICHNPPPCRLGPECFCDRGLSCAVAEEVLATFERIAARAGDAAEVARLADIRAKVRV